MIYNQNISDDVSLSQILDEFIESNESPRVILTFLKQYKSNLIDIIKYSSLSNRLFALDFIKKCSLTDLSNFTKLLENIFENHNQLGFFDHKVISNMFYQILQSNLDRYTINIFRKICVYNLKRLHAHPYNYSNKKIQEFDRIFCDINCDIDDIIEQINTIDDNEFISIASLLNDSLWYDRILQLDVFSLLSPIKQYFIVQKLRGKLIDGKIVKQWLISDLEVDIKKDIYNCLVGYISIYEEKNSNELLEILNSKDESYESMIFKLYLMGVDRYASDLIYNLLIIGSIDTLKLMLKNNKDILENHFNICDLLEVI